MMQRLFVYGTLRPGQENAHLLERIGGHWQKAFIRGVLCPKGFASTGGYPALVLDENADVVSGFVFSSPHLERHWPALNDFEGDGYRCVVTRPSFNDGKQMDVYVYAAKL